MVARSRKIYYRGTATVLLFCIVFDLHVHINSVNPLNGNGGIPLHCCRAKNILKVKQTVL
jgi:hypothetical protein